MATHMELINMPNMKYCMFENTSKDMQDIIDKIYEDDFHPDNLSKTERRYYDALLDQVQTMSERLYEIEEMIQEDSEEYDTIQYIIHDEIIGNRQTYKNFHNSFDDQNTFTREE